MTTEQATTEQLEALCLNPYAFPLEKRSRISRLAVLELRDARKEIVHLTAQIDRLIEERQDYLENDDDEDPPVTATPEQINALAKETDAYLDKAAPLTQYSRTTKSDE